MTRKIAIFDTTLRDGEQSPGASMNAFKEAGIPGTYRSDVAAAPEPGGQPAQLEVLFQEKHAVSGVGQALGAGQAAQARADDDGVEGGVGGGGWGHGE